jgi:HK97 family phage portal protein
MNIFEKAFVNLALKNKEIQKTIDVEAKEIIDRVLASKIEPLTTKIEQDLSKIEKRQYITTSTQKKFDAKEYHSGKNYKVLDMLYSEAPGSAQCADRIINSVTGTGYTLKRTDPRAKKSDLKRLITFFDKVNNEGDTIEEVVDNCLESALAYGDTYFEKVKTKDGSSIAEIYNLNTPEMKILVDEEKMKGGVMQKVGYERKTGFNREIVYDINEIIHLKTRSRDAGLYGKAVLEDNSLTLLMVINALNYNNSILDKGGYVPFVIELPTESSENDAKQVQSWFTKNNMGVFNAGNPIILFKGAKMVVAGIKPTDIQYMELLNFGVKIVCGQYGVPLALIGIPEGSNRSTSAESRKSYYHTKIYPLRDRISLSITNDIIREGFNIDGWKLSFKTAGLEESDSARRDIMNAFRTGVYTFNEARSKMGMQPIDKLWAENYYLIGSKNDMALDLELLINKTNENIDDFIGRGNSDYNETENNKEPGEGADESDV